MEYPQHQIDLAASFKGPLHWQFPERTRAAWFVLVKCAVRAFLKLPEEKQLEFLQFEDEIASAPDALAVGAATVELWNEESSEEKQS